MAGLVLQTVIGLTFIFAIFAAAVSVVSEAVTRYLGLRAEYLLRGIRSLVDGGGDFRLHWGELMPGGIGNHFVKARAGRQAAETAQAKTATATVKAESGKPMTEGEPRGSDGEQPEADADAALVAQIMSHPLVASSAKQARPPAKAGDRAMSNQDRRKLPSYVAARTFARALIDILAREHGDHPNANPVHTLRDWVNATTPTHKHLAEALRPLLAAADDLASLEQSIASWYDDQMARVTGWYKRHVKWISLGIGLVLVVAFNVSAIKIADALYSDQALSTSVVAEATRASSCHAESPAQCVADLRTEIGKIRGTGLPIGWADDPACAARTTCSWMDRHDLASISKDGSADVWTFLLVLLGWAVMILALLPGARFWFDLLSRLGSLRSTGPKPAT